MGMRAIKGMILACLVLGAGELPAAARPLGIPFRSWVFSPYGEIALSYDSNVYKTRANEIEDFYWEPEIGLRFSSSAETNRIAVLGNVFYSQRSFVKETSQDFRSFGNALTLRYGQQVQDRVEFVQSFRRIQDIDRHAADYEDSPLSAAIVQDTHTLSAQRDILQAGGALNRTLTDKVGVKLSARYATTVYDEDRYLDLDGMVGNAEAAARLSDKSALLGQFSYGLQKQEGTDGSAISQKLRLGLQSRGTDKLRYRIVAGNERYERPRGSGGETLDNLSVETSVDWFMTEKTTVRGGGRNGVQLSSFYARNGMEYWQAWTGIGYRQSPRWIYSARVVYRHDDYLDPVSLNGRPLDRRDDRLEGHARVDYAAPSHILRVFLDASYSYVESNYTPVEYDLIRVMLGATVRY